MRKAVEEAKKHLQKARELAAQIPSPFKGMTLEQAIKKMRQTRDELWEAKFASGVRHK